WMHGGLLHDVRMHGSEDLANEWARRQLGVQAVDSAQANVDDGEYDDEIHVCQLRTDSDEIRIETWYV
ncbi:MAG: hypothetical protein ACE5JM_17525, partial [Armatimonadota bacterium]